MTLWGRTESKAPKKVLEAQVAPTKVSKVRQEILNERFRELLKELCLSIEEFKLFDMNRVELSIGTSRSQGKTGVWAYVTPLRYVGGALYRKGVRRGFPGYYTYVLGNTNLEDEKAPLYMMTFLVPRFFNLSFRERIETLVHELYHCHPQFRGDLRRFPKPHIHHGPTPKAYQKKVEALTDEALRNNPSLKENHLLVGTADDYIKFKKKKCHRPQHKFVTKIGLWALGFAFSIPQLLAQNNLDEHWPPTPTIAEQQKFGRDWLWPWEKEKPEYEGALLPPLKGDFEEFDQKDTLKSADRYLVASNEEAALKSAPAPMSKTLHVVNPQESYLAVAIDKSGEWVFVRSRKYQGWLLLREVKVVGKLEYNPTAQIPDPVPMQEQSVSPSYSVRETVPQLKKSPPVKVDPLLTFDRDLDQILTTRSGPLYEQPDPLAVRFAHLQEGDSVWVLKRDVTGQWAYVRFLLTGVEGWFPANWLRITRGYKVQGAGKGRLVLDFDGLYGFKGHKQGLGGALAIDVLGAKHVSDNRFEIGAFYNQFAGQVLQIKGKNSNNVYSLETQYTLMGLMGRYVAFAPEGLFGGALEFGATYHKPIYKTSGLGDDVLTSTGVLEGLKPGLGAMGGIRGMVSVTSWLQINAMLRVNIASKGTFFWTGAGLSLRLF